MPKRKASEASGADGGGVKSPNPRKKSKQEQLAAAKAWHDKRSLLGGGSTKDTAVVNPSNSSKRTPPCSSSTLTNVKTATKSDDDVVATQSPLFRDEKSSTKGGGNALLKSLRKQNVSTANDSKKSHANDGSKHEDVTSKPPATASVVMNGSTATYVPPSQKTGIIEGILLLLVVLNVAAVIYMIYNQQTSLANIHKQYVSEVGQLKEELSKSQEVNTLLQSGIGLLEQELQMKRNKEKVSDISNMYNIELDHYGEEQSQAEKDAWQERIRLLEVEKELGLDELDAKLVELGITEGKSVASEECENTDLCDAAI